MTGRWLLVLGLTLGCKKGDPFVDPPETTPPTPDAPVTLPDDTAGPPPRCALHEEEPNASFDEALFLPMEQRGCGSFQEAVDSDAWWIDVENDGDWLRVELWAYGIGSKAWPALQLVAEDGSVSWLRDASSFAPDPVVYLPLDAGRYQLVVRPVLGDGVSVSGDDAFYELRASVAKMPGPPDVVVTGEVNVLPPGKTGFGSFTTGTTVQRWRLFAPEDGVLTVDVQAWEEGAYSDVDLFVTVLGEEGAWVRGGRSQVQPDPWFREALSQGASVEVEVHAKGAPLTGASWYVLSTSWESP